MNKLAVFPLLAIFCAWRIDGLSCPCWKDGPPVLGPAPTNCPSGPTTDACGCSWECAQSLAEDCGGPFNITGKCGDDLECLRPYVEEEHPNMYFNSNGVCVPTAVYNDKVAANVIRLILQRDLPPLHPF